MGSLSRAFDAGERRRLGAFFAVIVLLHVAGWGLLLSYAMARPALLALGLAAYSFGLRHAFDADHISAIDNTTRKLLQDGRKPVGVGFFFSLGHSSVVFGIALAIGLAVRWIYQSAVSDNGQLRSLGGELGLGVSGVFLVLIGLLNLVILLDILKVYRRLKRGEFDREGLNQELVAGGVMTRVFSRLFKLITASWQMYPIGFLFGLGFDTASEVALLATTGSVAAQGLPFLAVISLPLIFAAGMSLMDTADGAFMSKAYSWAFTSPVRRIFYNLTVTALSVFVALFIGLLELGQIGIGVTGVRGAVFDLVGAANLTFVGYGIVAAFIVTWAAAFAVYRWRRVEERWGSLLEAGD